MEKLKNTQFYETLKQYYLYARWLLSWKKTSVPHLVKQKTIKGFAKKTGNKMFVETGTYKGDMVYAVRNYFEKIFSIELSKDLACKAANRFKNYKHITIVSGNSASELSNVLTKIDGNCIFWLDGHYSAGFTAKGNTNTPIINELKTILKFAYKAGSVILIDDARLFIGKDDYPLLSDVYDLLKNKFNYNMVYTKNDIVIAYKN